MITIGSRVNTGAIVLAATERMHVGTVVVTPPKFDSGCTTTLNSPTVLDPFITAADVGKLASGPNIPLNAVIVSVDLGEASRFGAERFGATPSSFTVNVNATATQTGLTMTLTPIVPPDSNGWLLSVANEYTLWDFTTSGGPLPDGRTIGAGVSLLVEIDDTLKLIGGFDPVARDAWIWLLDISDLVAPVLGPPIIAASFAVNANASGIYATSTTSVTTELGVTFTTGHLTNYTYDRSSLVITQGATIDGQFYGSPILLSDNLLAILFKGQFPGPATNTYWLSTISGGVPSTPTPTAGVTLTGTSNYTLNVASSSGGNTLVFTTVGSNSPTVPWQCILPNGSLGAPQYGILPPWIDPTGNTGVQFAMAFSIAGTFDSFYLYFWDSAGSTAAGVYQMFVDGAGNIFGGPPDSCFPASTVVPPNNGFAGFGWGGPFPVTELSGASSAVPQLALILQENTGQVTLWDLAAHTLSNLFVTVPGPGQQTEFIPPTRDNPSGTTFTENSPWFILKNYYYQPNNGVPYFATGPLCQWGDNVAVIGTATFYVPGTIGTSAVISQQLMVAEVLEPSFSPSTGFPSDPSTFILDRYGTWSIGAVLLDNPSFGSVV